MRFASVAGASASRLALRAIGSLRSSSGTAAPPSISSSVRLRMNDRLAAPDGMMRLPGSIDDTSTSIEASASAAASGFIWSMNGQSVPAMPTAPNAPVARIRKSRRVTPVPTSCGSMRFAPGAAVMGWVVSAKSCP